MTQSEVFATERVSYGGFVDAAGGIATVILAIIGLTGMQEMMLLSIVTIIFGASLLIQGGTMLSEYARLIYPAGATTGPMERQFGGGALSSVFIAGATGVILGVLSLLGMFPLMLSSIAVIAFGAALVLSSNSVLNMHEMRMAMMRQAQPQMYTGNEILAAEMATGSAGIQALAGLAAIVLGILAIIGGMGHPVALSMVALLGLGGTLIMTGTTLSGVVEGFMRPATEKK
jgi:hypothetical protein